MITSLFVFQNTFSGYPLFKLLKTHETNILQFQRKQHTLISSIYSSSHQNLIMIFYQVLFFVGCFYNTNKNRIMAPKYMHKNLRIVIEDSNTESPINLNNQAFQQGILASDMVQNNIPLYNSEVIESYDNDNQHHYQARIQTFQQYAQRSRKMSKEIEKQRMAKKLEIQAVESRLNQNINSLQKSVGAGSRSKSLRPSLDQAQLKKEAKQNMSRSIYKSRQRENSSDIHESKQKILGDIVKKLGNRFKQSYTSLDERRYRVNEANEKYSRREGRNLSNLKKQITKKSNKNHEAKLQSTKITTKLNKLENMLKDIKELNREASRIRENRLLSQKQYETPSQHAQHRQNVKNSRNKSLAKISQQLKLAKGQLHEAQKKNIKVIQKIRRQRTHHQAHKTHINYNSSREQRFPAPQPPYTFNNNHKVQFDKSSPIGILQYNFSNEQSSQKRQNNSITHNPQFIPHHNQYQYSHYHQPHHK